jgi:UDP-N-acetylglucosamine 2-epimerase (non-hydrolysing)/GDP/UDP-N,N'-diacetylbacillosamine 2-epimerase (hydrolysing)
MNPGSTGGSRTVCVVTGTRAEYGLLRAVMRRVADSPALALRVVATGMHLSAEFGHTIDEITGDGFRVDASVDMLLSHDSTGAMAKGIGIGIYGLTQTFESMRPDVVLLLGDRVEPFAASIAACFLRIPVAHIHGGDVAMGGFDEYMRPTITRFAHLHFAATEQSRRRILRLGEREEFVYTVGAPGVDEVVAMPLLDRRELEARFGLPAGRPFLLAVQHSVSTEPEAAARQMEETLGALDLLALPTVLVYPNADAGGRAMIDRIKAHEAAPFLRAFRSLGRRDYLSLLAACGALVGNSSSGMIESASFKVPVVNVGVRQQHRERSSNVLDVAHDRGAIAAAVRTALEDPAFRAQVERCVNPYGDGKASERIVDVLSTVPLDERLLRKPVPA